MKTVIFSKQSDYWDELLYEAALTLKSGGLVAFPTETVYGLGANAGDAEAVSKIFSAKGRPSDNPLIVHIADKKGLAALVKDVSAEAELLIDKFWPGALTLVFRKSDKVPLAVSAGLDTVAIRMPANAVALELLRLASVPVAAPSANRSGRPSPTTAQHVMEDLEGLVPFILDDGPCEFGIESTVLDMTVTPPMILRPGGVTREMLEAALGSSVSIDAATGGGSDVKSPKSPGMKYAHYAPRAFMWLYTGSPDPVGSSIAKDALEFARSGKRVGILSSEEWKERWNRGLQQELAVLPDKGGNEGVFIRTAGRRSSPGTLAAGIFAALREFDAEGVDIILAEGFSEKGIGKAIMNRLQKAAGGNLKVCR